MHVMIDIETMGRAPRGVILAVGAVAFDDEKEGPSFYKTIRIKDIGNEYRDINPDTVMWWLVQNEEARQALCDPSTQDTMLHVLKGLSDFVKENLGEGDMVWANGVNFDIAILEDAYHDNNMTVPWSYVQVACMRSLRAIERYRLFDIKWDDCPKGGHNALADASTQAHYVMSVIKKKTVQNDEPVGNAQNL